MRRLLGLLVLITPLLAVEVRAQDAVPPVALEREIYQAFQQREYGRALGLIEGFLEGAPRNVDMLYNAACAHSRLDRRDEAAAYLYKAVKAGFRDFSHMRRDPDLENVRDHPTFLAILEASELASRRSADELLAQWRRSFKSEAYRYEKDDTRRLAYATALDQVSHEEMRAMIEAEADHLAETLFESMPDYHVIIAIPTPRDADRLFQNPEIGGIYQHAQRRLIARDIGNALRHEFFHLMHYGHMERLAQAHRLWVQEGMASLYENYELSEDGDIRFLPNFRHNIVFRRARTGLLVRWDKLFDMTSDQFMQRADHLYPQVRSMFEFIADRGKLEPWYEAYVEHFAEDPGGAVALESVFGQPVETIEREWRKWVLGRGQLDVSITYGDAALGVIADARSSNDGVVVEEVLPGSAAHRGRIRRRDVIVAIDGQATRSMSELQEIIASKEVGDRVEVRIRRRGTYLDVPVVLRPHRPF
ncbi:MAG: TPR end-of-group domain-containing protein [Planctomycetota bacterium]|jgi:hypothetical protein